MFVLSRSTKRLLAVGSTTALFVVPWAPAFAGNGNSNDKQTICHATRSNTNPYVVNTPNKNGDVDGHAKHTGPVWTPTLKALHIRWGDIIPPFDYNDHGTAAHFPGLNWDANGQAWFANGCRVPPPPPPDVSIVKAGTPTAAPGDELTWTLTATNDGSVPASGVTVTDTLPTDTTLVTVGGTGWTCAGTTDLSCTLDADLGVGQSAVVTVVATLSAGFTGTTISNTAVVTPDDVTPTDNTSTAVTDVTQPSGGGGGGGFTGGGGGTQLTGGGGGPTTLPRTGRPIELTAASAVAMLLAGMMLVLLAPRRRILA